MPARRPLLIGIGGGSGAGKTTLALQLRQLLGPRVVRVIHMDHFYKPAARMPRYYSKSQRTWNPDYNRPDAFDWSKIRVALINTWRPRIIILEGLFALGARGLRSRMGLKIFVTCPEKVRIHRLLRRGVPGWSRKRHRIYLQECVLAGHRSHVIQCQAWANLIISGQ